MPEDPYANPLPPLLEDPDARLGGHDDPAPETDVLLEKLHAEATKAAAERKGTRYEVWLLVEGAEDTAALWSPIGVCEASSGRDAIRRAVVDFPQHFGTTDVVRAVPARNITQVTLSTETTTRLRLS